MKTEYSYLLHLLGAYLRREAPEIREDVDWEELEKLAQIHGVIGILGYMTRMHPICPDEQRQAKLRQLCRKTVAHFTQRLAGAEELLRALEAAGIDHIVMKGYVLRQLYPVPELRSFNDIDLVIRPEDRQRSDELMLSLGFHRHTDWEPVFSYVRGNEMYELHTDIMEIDVSDRADYMGYFRSMWDHARPVGEHSRQFTPEFHCLYLLTHIAKHVYGSGAGVRMYLDVAAFVQHYGETLDWNWVREQLKQLELCRFADVVLTAAEDWFGIACPGGYDKVTGDVMDPFLVYTLEAGVFGHHDREGALASLKHTDQAAAAPRLRQILHRTFPDAKTIEKRYTYLQDKPWLLPAAWVHRVIKNRDRLNRRAQEVQEILLADTEEIRKLQKLMGEIGL